MIFRQLDSNGDWTFGKGRSNYAKDAEAVAVNIRTTLLSWTGDCFFDLKFGVDWTRLLDTGQQKNLQVSLESVILKSYGVVSVQSVSSTFDAQSRKLDVQYVATTVFSQNFQSQVNILAGAVGD